MSITTMSSVALSPEPKTSPADIFIPSLGGFYDGVRFLKKKYYEEPILVTGWMTSSYMKTSFLKEVPLSFEDKSIADKALELHKSKENAASVAANLRMEKRLLDHNKNYSGYELEGITYGGEKYAVAQMLNNEFRQCYNKKHLSQEDALWEKMFFYTSLAIRDEGLTLAQALKLTKEGTEESERVFRFQKLCYEKKWREALAV